MDASGRGQGSRVAAHGGGEGDLLAGGCQPEAAARNRGAEVVLLSALDGNPI